MIILVEGRNKTRVEREGEEGNFNGWGANKSYQQTNKHLDIVTYRVVSPFQQDFCDL